MAENKTGEWLNCMAITTVLVAVCATMSTFKGGGFSTRSLLNQSKASDQWAFYQSKSIKGYMYGMEKDNLELQLLSMPNSSKALQDAYNSKILAYAEKIKKYEEDKEIAKKSAESFELIRDESKKHSEAFGMAVIFLQMSILLSSIAALSKKKSVWLISVVLGLIGACCFANGFWLFF